MDIYLEMTVTTSTLVNFLVTCYIFTETQASFKNVSKDTNTHT